MPSHILDELTQARRLLETADAAELIRLHERLLFVRAYPPSLEAAHLADRLLADVGARASALDSDAFAEPEVSGIAGTSFSAVFSYEVARRLAQLYPRNVCINWDAYQETERLAPLLAFALPMFREEWPVEAHTPIRDWLGRRDLAWLLDAIERAPLDERGKSAMYDSLRLPLQWDLGNSQATRTRMRLPAGKLYCHREALLRRSDVSIARELDGRPLPCTRLTREAGRRILDRIVATSAVRYRELYGFSHPDEANVLRVAAGRGLEIYFFGVPAESRLPLRAYHCGMFFKNGVPAGYVETLSLFDHAEVGFNLYYTFREGESAWIYAQLLRLARQLLGVNYFSVDPYQIGHENEEAIQSGAFWFYRKLGFRPVDPALLRLTEREERRMAANPGYRTPPRTLKRLAQGSIVYEAPGAVRGEWDRFRIREVCRAVQQLPVFGKLPGVSKWSEREKRDLAAIQRAKQGGSEARYLRLMQRHARLREAVLRMGTS
jgi:hypothetical protein